MTQLAPMPGVAQAPARRASARTRARRSTLVSPGPTLLLVVGLLIWLWAVRVADPSSMGDLGLSTVLGWQYWIALVAVIASLVWALARPHSRPVFPVVGLIIVLFATAPAIEGIARLPTGWVHAGFINYIALHGDVLTGYDARFSWPGFFSLGAVLDAITGQHDPTVYLRWAPLFFELAYLAPLRVIAKSTVPDARAGWIGTALFYAANWIDQDYFSPQALNMLFFLVVVAAVVAFWRPRSPVITGEGGVARRWWRGLGQVDATLGARRQIGLELVLLVIFGACVASHQFTPYALVVALFALLWTRRLPGPELPLILGLMAVAWLSFATETFWSGHLSLVFKGVGSLGSVLGQNVSQRVTGALDHRLIIDLRLFLGLALITLAAAAALRRRGKSRTLEFLAATPFLLLAGGSYGGEALLRCFLFSLPFTSLLAGTVLVGLLRSPRHTTRVPTGQALALVAVIVCFAALLTVVRGGNDAFESFTHDERAAVTTVYRVATAGQRLGATTTSTDQLPWRDQDVGRLIFVDPVAANNAGDVAHSLERQRVNWVILTQNEERWGELVAGLALGWQSQVQRDLMAKGYTIYHQWPTATILEHTGSPHPKH